MKKVIIITVFLFSFFYIELNKYKKDIIKPVFNDKTYSSYIIDISCDSITTRNINKYITDEIDAVYPYVLNIKRQWFFIDKNISFEKNMNKLEKKYINYLNYLAKKEDALNIELEGIKLGKIKIMTNNISNYSKYSYTIQNYYNKY